MCLYGSVAYMDLQWIYVGLYGFRMVYGDVNVCCIDLWLLGDDGFRQVSMN